MANRNEEAFDLSSPRLAFRVSALHVGGGRLAYHFEAGEGRLTCLAVVDHRMRIRLTEDDTRGPQGLGRGLEWSMNDISG
jgi:hypothetical protein